MNVFVVENFGPGAQQLRRSAYMSGSNRCGKVGDKENTKSDMFPGCNSVTLRSYDKTNE